ncbi:myeloid leukemia factor 1 [Chanos chanos]|uniref:Myeloid leukemia factor 1 n=1 Tax=Chanos chanos TaxID=29144 RepID=A0A6J2VQS7_CHACN|nr:myeloid leukemia factor 1 [Chanos chanos]
MFNSLIRDFDEDPFFSSASDPFRAHSEHMRQMMRSLSEPFAHSFMPSLTDGRDRGRRTDGHSNSLALRNDHRDMGFMGPFSMMDNMMLSMRSRMEDMHRNFENMSADSNTHSFSSSSVMTYSKMGDEPAKVFQASSQTRRAPGGIKETRRSLRDSESGVEKMSIGHHIQDRGHVIEKKHNRKTGEREFNQDFQNMDETEAQAFDAEWQHKVSRFQPSTPMSQLEGPRPRTVHRAAIAGPEDTRREKTNAGEKKKQVKELVIEGSRVKK